MRRLRALAAVAVAAVAPDAAADARASFFQVHDAFVGPRTGIRFVRPGGEAPSYTGTRRASGAGCALGVLDLEVQVRTDPVNDPPGGGTSAAA